MWRRLEGHDRLHHDPTLTGYATCTCGTAFFEGPAHTRRSATKAWRRHLKEHRQQHRRNQRRRPEPIAGQRNPALTTRSTR